MMTRGFVAVLMVLSLAGPALAQDGWFHMGLKGGLSWANISYDPEPSYGDHSRLMGFGAGVAIDMATSPSLHLATDVLYMRKGIHSQYDFREGGGGHVRWEEDVKLNYIVVAPMLRFLVQKPGFFPYAMIGAEVGYLLDAEVDKTMLDQEGDFQTDLSDSFKDMDYGLTFGGGMEFPTGSGRTSFFVEGRYSLGLAEIQDDNDTSATAQKHRCIYMLSGIRF